MRQLLLLTIALLVCSIAKSQNNIGIGTANPRPFAALEIKSSDKGLLVPRGDTTDASWSGLSTLDHGLIIYDTIAGGLFVWNGSNFESATSTGLVPTLQSAYDGGQTINMGSGNIHFISNSANSVLYIDELNENIGIGTASPNANYSLDVNGDIQVNGLRIGLGNANLSNNTVLGMQALNVNTTGNSNVAVGTRVLAANTTGIVNTAIGYEAMFVNTDGLGNSAVGAVALGSNVTGNFNNAFGHFALFGNSIGSDNNAIGDHALSINTSGQQNIGIGSYAIGSNLIGNANIAIGHNAGINNTASNNTAIGTSALIGNTTGSENTTIGFQSNVALNNLTNATALGANSIVGASNSLVLGNNANVGIGTSTPANKLEVIGDAAKFDSVIIVNGAQAGYVLTSADATGAASWQPGASAHSLQSAYDGGKTIQLDGTNDITISNNGTTPILNLDNNGNLRLGNAAASIGTVKLQISHDVANSEPMLHIQNTNNAGDASLRFWQGAAATPFAIGVDADDKFFKISNGNQLGIGNRFTIDNLGNVGIGTNTPHAPLQFTTSLANRKIVLFEGADNDHQYFGFGVNGAALRYQVNGTFASHIFYASVNTTTSNELMRIVGDGRVGIGTSTPTAGYRLDVTGGDAIINGVTVGRGGGNNTNTALGENALASNAGADNIGIGRNALQNNLGGLNNIAIGNNSLGLNTTGGGNLAIGHGSQNGAAGTGDNVSLGNNTLTGNQGNLNTALGNNTLANNTTGNSNHAIGFNALNGNLIGSGNIAMGNEALFVSDADANIAIGGRALIGNTSGSWNVSIGSRSSENTVDGANNTALGAFSMGQNISGTNNTAIGYNSGPAVGSPNLTNATAIGAGASVSASNSLVLGNNANVGIGTSAPSSPLHILSSVGGITRAASVFMDVNSANTDSRAYLRFSQDATSLQNPVYWGVDFENGISQIFSNDNIDFMFGGLNTERFRIQAATGNVGIGTSTPENKLHVVGTDGGVGAANSGTATTGNMRLTESGSVPAMDFGIADDSYLGGWIQVHSPFNQATNYNLLLNPNGGNVGVGTTAPSYTLDITGGPGVRIAPTTGGENFVTFINSNDGNVSWGINDGWTVNRDFRLYRYNNAGTFLDQPLTVQNSSGNVGINVINPTFKLHVNGSVAGVGAYNNLSDKRFKKNVEPISEPLQKVMALEGISFEWDKTLNPNLEIDDKRHLGFLAQDVEKILPNVVNTANDSINTKTVEYASIVPVLVEAIKAQQTTIEDQKKIIADINAKLQDMELANKNIRSSEASTQVMLIEMKAQIDRLNTILSSEASK